MNRQKQQDPLSNLTSLHGQIDTMFRGLLGPMDNLHAMPDVDIYTENDMALIVEVHAAGFREEDLTINVSDNVLEIRGQRLSADDTSRQKRNYMVRESVTDFYRSIALPRQADTDHIEANFENGVLRVVVPYRDKPAPQTVAIRTGTRKKAAKK
jgi:HSP20 family protein